MRVRPAELRGDQCGKEQHGHENHVYQRPGGDAPELCARTFWGRHVRHAAERPEDDIVSLAADLATGELMAEFVQEHDQEQAEILQHVPDDGGVLSGPIPNHEIRHHKPEPMNVHADAREREQLERSAAGGCHIAPLMSCSNCACDSTAWSCGNSRFTFSGAWIRKPMFASSSMAVSL